MSDDLHLDGNGVSGLLAEALSADPSTLVRRCATCGSEHVMGEHRAYRGAGVVLRCPSCGDTAVIIGVFEERLTVQVRGTFTLVRPPG
jgi:predicted RNA-binding Zn-ribbon protein involved in translation (DUF1610 family)